jgi:2-methylcitrate dehydratase PrpD
MDMTRRKLLASSVVLPALGSAAALAPLAGDARAQPGHQPSSTRLPLSERLATFVSGLRYEQLPAQVVASVRHSILDALGVGIAASGLEPVCVPFLDHARTLAGQGRAQVLGAGFTAPATFAALANGAMAHALDYEDVHEASSTHPNAATVAAAWALAEELGDVDGRRLIAAVAAGSEVAIRLALARGDDWTRHGWYIPPIVGSFGAAAAAANLLGLTPRQTLAAFSMTLCQASCSAEILHSPAADIRAVRDGFAAQAGLMSAQLAHSGVAGFDRPIEGKAGFYAMFARNNYRPEAVVDQLGTRFHNADVAFKAWPSCRGTHLYVQAALQCHREGLTDPVEIVCTVHPRNAELCTAQKARPVSAIDAKFSIPFSVATALRTGQVTLGSFSPRALADPDTLALAARVRAVHDPDRARPTSAGGGTVLELVMADGSRHARDVHHLRGSIADPMGSDELRAKFIECGLHGARTPSRDGLQRLADALLALEEVADISTLLRDL